MYYEAILKCARSLENFDSSFQKAELFAKEKGIDLSSLLQRRLAPDMAPLIYQIQSASDYVKGGAAYLSGQNPPRFTDYEETIEDLRERIAKTSLYVRSIEQEKFVGAADRIISRPWFRGKVLTGKDYLFEVVIPNVYFHIDIAYAILRNAGVDVGKADALGELSFQDPAVG